MIKCMLTASLLLLAGQAGAQEPPPMCGNFQAIRTALADNLHMVEVAGGMVDEQTFIVILANPEGTWASFSLAPDGTACLGAKGEDWFQVRIPAPGERPA